MQKAMEKKSFKEYEPCIVWEMLPVFKPQATWHVNLVN